MLRSIHTREAQCDKHGETYYETDLFGDGTFRGACPQCQQEADARRAAEQAVIDARHAHAEAQASIQRRMEAAGLPSRYADKTFASLTTVSLEQRRAIELVMAYATDREALKAGRGLILSGTVGTGKTHLAAAIINTVVSGGKKTSARYTTARAMIRDVRAAWSDRELSEAKQLAAYTAPSMLVIDELGAQFASDSERVILFEILDQRYAERLPTVIISNLTPDEIKGVLGDRIIDRLREDGGLVVSLRWESHRGGAV